MRPDPMHPLTGFARYDMIAATVFPYPPLP